MLSDFNLPSPSYTNFYRKGKHSFPKNSTYYETFRGNDGVLCKNKLYKNCK